MAMPGLTCCSEGRPARRSSSSSRAMAAEASTRRRRGQPDHEHQRDDLRGLQRRRAPRHRGDGVRYRDRGLRRRSRPLAEPGARILLSGGGYSGRPDLNTADFNGDHHADVAISGNDNGDVFVYLGNGRGRFRLAEGTPEYGGIYRRPRLRSATSTATGHGPDRPARWRRARAPRASQHRWPTPRHLRPQTISMIGPEPAEVVRGEGVTLSARLRCHPGNVALYRRPLRRPRGPWRRIATGTDRLPRCRRGQRPAPGEL